MSSEPFFFFFNLLLGTSIEFYREPKNSFPMTVTESDGNLKGLRVVLGFFSFFFFLSKAGNSSEGRENPRGNFLFWKGEYKG